MTDIFDLNNLDDLPEKIKDDLSIDKFENRILILFDIAKRSLSVDEVTIAYFRKFGKEDIKNKRQIVAKLYNMSRSINPKIESVPHKKGIYRLRSKKNNGNI